MFSALDMTNFARCQSETCFRNAHFSKRSTIHANLKNVSGWHLLQNSTQHTQRDFKIATFAGFCTVTLSLSKVHNFAYWCTSGRVPWKLEFCLRRPLLSLKPFFTRWEFSFLERVWKKKKKKKKKQQWLVSKDKGF